MTWVCAECTEFAYHAEFVQYCQSLDTHKHKHKTQNQSSRPHSAVSCISDCRSSGHKFKFQLSPIFAGLGGSFGCTSDWRSGVTGLIPAVRQNSSIESDHEIFYMVILSLPLIQEGQSSVCGERMCTSTG